MVSYGFLYGVIMVLYWIPMVFHGFHRFSATSGHHLER